MAYNYYDLVRLAMEEKGSLELCHEKPPNTPTIEEPIPRVVSLNMFKWEKGTCRLTNTVVMTEKDLGTFEMDICSSPCLSFSGPTCVLSEVEVSQQTAHALQNALFYHVQSVNPIPAPYTVIGYAGMCIQE